MSRSWPPLKGWCRGVQWGGIGGREMGSGEVLIRESGCGKTEFQSLAV